MYDLLLWHKHKQLWCFHLIVKPSLEKGCFTNRLPACVHPLTVYFSSSLHSSTHSIFQFQPAFIHSQYISVPASKQWWMERSICAIKPQKVWWHSLFVIRTECMCPLLTVRVSVSATHLYFGKMSSSNHIAFSCLMSLTCCNDSGVIAYSSWLVLIIVEIGSCFTGTTYPHYILCRDTVPDHTALHSPLLNT